jgi:hypothetical protein
MRRIAIALAVVSLLGMLTAAAYAERPGAWTAPRPGVPMVAPGPYHGPQPGWGPGHQPAGHWGPPMSWLPPAPPRPPCYTSYYGPQHPSFYISFPRFSFGFGY